MVQNKLRSGCHRICGGWSVGPEFGPGNYPGANFADEGWTAPRVAAALESADGY